MFLGGIFSNIVRLSGGRLQGPLDPKISELRHIIELVSIFCCKVPLMVNATVGSTVVGAFDDLTAIRHVLDKFEVSESANFRFKADSL